MAGAGAEHGEVAGGIRFEQARQLIPCSCDGALKAQPHAQIPVPGIAIYIFQFRNDVKQNGIKRPSTILQHTERMPNEDQLSLRQRALTQDHGKRL